MTCDPRPQFVHIATSAYSARRCAACDRRLTAGDEALEGNFPFPTPDRLILVRALVCAPCLDGVKDTADVRRLALAILGHLAAWQIRDRETGGRRQSRQHAQCRGRRTPNQRAQPLGRS